MVGLAAVIGRTFGLPLLEKLVSHDQLRDALLELQRLDLIVEKRRRPAPEYRFRHGLVQEVAYATLVEPTRRDLHRRVGEALEDLYKDYPEEVYELLARHFSEADEPEKAVEYLLAAGDAARRIYADQEALAHYRSARAFLARLGDERRARDTLFKMALAYHLASDFEQAEKTYDEAFCCRVEEPTTYELTARVETAAQPPDEISPGDVYTTEGGQFISHLFQGLLHRRPRAERRAGDGGQHARLERRARVPVPPEGGRALERRRAGHRRGLRLRVDEDPRGTGGHRVPPGGHRVGDGARRPHARGTAARTAQRTSPTSSRRPGPTRGRSTRASRSATPGAIPKNLVSNGPFVLAELNDDGALLAANPHFVGERGNVKEIAITFARGPVGETVKEWIDGRYDVLHVHDPRARDAENTIVRSRAGALDDVRRLPPRHEPVLERARPQGVLARDRPRGAEAGAASASSRPR